MVYRLRRTGFFIVPAIIALAGIAVCFLVGITGSHTQLLRTIAIVVSVCAFIWLWRIYPIALLDASGVTVRNMFRTIHIQWENLATAACHAGVVLTTADHHHYPVTALQSATFTPRQVEQANVNAAHTRTHKPAPLPTQGGSVRLAPADAAWHINHFAHGVHVADEKRSRAGKPRHTGPISAAAATITMNWVGMLIALFIVANLAVILLMYR